MKTPKKSKNASEKERKEPKLPRVYDFIYSDSRRIAAFISQFNRYGSFQQIRASEAVAETAENVGNRQLSGNIGVLAGRLGSLAKDSTTTNEGKEITYDPLWTNAVKFMEHLSENDLIRHDIGTANLGQFILVSGPLLIYDLEVFKSAWGKKSIRQLVETSQKQQAAIQKAARARGKSVVVETPPNAELLLDLVGIMPHTIQATILSENVSVWCTLDTGSLVGQSSDSTEH